MAIIRTPRVSTGRQSGGAKGTSRYSASAMEALRQNGVRVTKPRQAIVELLEKATKPLTAMGIHEALQKWRVQVDLASIYRSLALLEAQGLIHRLISVEGVVRCEPGFEGSPCHHHLVCRQCGTVREVRCDGQTGLSRRVREEQGFAVDGHAVELTGLCADCRTAEGSAASGA